MHGLSYIVVNRDLFDDTGSWNAGYASCSRHRAIELTPAELIEKAT